MESGFLFQFCAVEILFPLEQRAERICAQEHKRIGIFTQVPIDSRFDIFFDSIGVQKAFERVCASIWAHLKHKNKFWLQHI